jgi:predicted secreted protein
MLFTVPHGLTIRTQNDDGDVMAGVATAAALPPMGEVKSKTCPAYH